VSSPENILFKNLILTSNADRVRQTAKTPWIEESDEAFTEALGARLAEVLKLRRDPNHADRWDICDGNVTNKGLARRIVRILEEI